MVFDSPQHGIIAMVYFLNVSPFFQNFCKPAISLKNLIRSQMRKSLNVFTAENMPSFEIYITWSVSPQNPGLTRPLEEVSSSNHLFFLKICSSSVYTDGDKHFGPSI